MSFEKDTYINLLYYILSKCYNKPHIGKTVLCTILYYIDFAYYERYGCLLTEETYIKTRKGIRPKHFMKVTQDLIEKRKLFLRKEPYYNRIIHRYYLAIIPQTKFGEKELEIIDSCIKKLINHNATSISKYTRKDPPVNIAEIGDELDYRHVFLRNYEYPMPNIE